MIVVGTGVLVAYVVQGTLGVEWPWLVEMQGRDGYKIASGLALAAYLAMQWRVRNRRGDFEHALFVHRVGGVFAPVVLYAHASRFAYGYLAWLCAVYLGTVIAGLLHQPVLALRTRWVYTLWFVVHLAVATALVVLGGYHAVIALQYE